MSKLEGSIIVNGVEFSHQNIFDVVDEFYTLIQQDPVLKVPFASVHDWPEHVERLTHFWWIRFGGKPYMMAEYNPAYKHFFAGFNDELLERWLGLFHGVIAKHLNAEQAGLWTLVSNKMGQGLLMKNEMLKAQYSRDPK